MSEQEIRAAALARAGAVAQRFDRPRSRHNAERTAGEPTRAVFGATMTVREADAGANQVSFSGVATAYERGYTMYDFFGPYTEIVNRGAGANSLARSDIDVPLVIAHDQTRRIARTTNGSLILRETDTGLEVNAPNLNMEDQDVAYIVPKLRDGLIDEMSFAFRITRGTWSPDYTEYRIEEYDIHRGDVAIVGYGANPHTSAEVRSYDMRALIPIEETRLLPYL